MKILVGCEFSGTVRDKFAAKGHEAWSCDLLLTEKPGFHFIGDVFDFLDEGWDLIIMHPPCTALAVSGNSTYGEGMPKYAERLKACKWTKDLWDACKNVCNKVCFENPVGVLPRMAGFPKPQYIQPWQFGHLETKKTGLFLHGLPELIPTTNLKQETMALPPKERMRLHYLPPSKDRWKIRSTTYEGIAQAMADQWGALT